MSVNSLRSEGRLSDVNKRLWADALSKTGPKFNRHVYIKNAANIPIQHNFIVTDSITGKYKLDINEILKGKRTLK